MSLAQEKRAHKCGAILTCGAEGMIGSCITVLCRVPTNSDKGTAADVAGFV